MSRVDQIKQIMKNVGTRVTSVATMPASFSLPAFSTGAVAAAAGSPKLKYLFYGIVAIATLVALIMFLQALGVNIVKQRPGASGIVANPFSSGDSKSIDNPTDTAALVDFSKNIANPSVFTVSTLITINRAAQNRSPNIPVMLLYYGNNTVSTDGNDPQNVNTLFSNPAAKNFQFAIWMNGDSNYINVQFNDGSTNINSLSIVRLDNPPFDKQFRLTIVVNANMAEVYSGSKLVRTVITRDGSSISPYNSPSQATFKAPVNTNISVDKVTIWNAPLNVSEIAAL